MNCPNQCIAVFPGTFDPITNGHLDVIRRAVGLFNRLIVAIGTNPAKQELFTLDERHTMIEHIVAEQKIDAEVACYRNLTVDFARSVGASVIVRGLRNASDLAHEAQLALTNRAVAEIETVFIMTGATYGLTSSSLIKQIAAGGDIDRLERLLPRRVIETMKQKKPMLLEWARLSDAHTD